MLTVKPRERIYRASLAIALIALALGIVFNFFINRAHVGISFPLFILLVLGGYIWMARYLRQPLRRSTLLLGLAALFFSVMIFIHSSPTLTAINLLVTVALLLLGMATALGNRLSRFNFLDYAFVILGTPLRIIPRAFKVLNHAISPRAGSRKTVYGQILKGVVLAVPVVFIFVLLFSSADLVFQKYVNDIIRFHISGEVVGRLILILVVTGIIAGALDFIFQSQAVPETEASAIPGAPRSALGTVEISTFLGIIAALFLLFIGIQFAYLFGGQHNITAGAGFTYAEYAHRGFGELIAVSIISLLLILGAEHSVAKTGEKHNRAFMVLSVVIIAEVMVIMASALKRLGMYQDAYGLTELRLYSTSFIFLLIAAFLGLAYKLVRNRADNTFAFFCCIAILVYVAGLNLLNPDAYIARENIGQFRGTDKLDLFYLTTLSSDATPALVSALSDSPDPMGQMVAQRLYFQRIDLQNAKNSGWLSFHVSRKQALDALDSRAGYLERYKDFMPDDSMPIHD